MTADLSDLYWVRALTGDHRAVHDLAPTATTRDVRIRCVAEFEIGPAAAPKRGHLVPLHDALSGGAVPCRDCTAHQRGYR